MTYKIIDLKTGFLLVNNFIRNNSCYIEQSYYSKDKPNFTKQINFNDKEHAPKVFKYIEMNELSASNFNEEISPIAPNIKEFELKYDYSIVTIIDLNNSNNSQDTLSDFDYKDFLVKLSHYYVL
jgi:hypothetical protein